MMNHNADCLHINSPIQIPQILFGLIGVLVGMTLLFASLLGITFQGEFGESQTIAEGVIVGTLFLICGIVLTFERSGVIVSQASNQMTSWWGIMIPMRKKEFELSGVACVNVEFSMYSRYRVIVRGTDSHLLSLKFRHHKSAVNAATELSELLGVPFSDSSI